MTISIVEILFACLIMGLGIGADVALATFLRANNMTNKRTAFYWITGVTLTHTLFPMAGYLLAHFSITSAPLISPIIGILAFSFIAYFIIQELKLGDEISESSNSEHMLVTVGLILAVSWDALWSGPAKSAQVIGWPEAWIWSSFLIVGLVVAVFSVLSYVLAKRVSLTVQQPRWVLFNFGQWVQLSVIGYFAILALFRYTFDIQWLWWKLLIVSFLLMAIVLHKLAISHSSLLIEKEERTEKEIIKKDDGLISI